MPDYVNIILLLGGISVFVASLIYLRETYLFRKQTASMAREFVGIHRFQDVSHELEAYSHVEIGDRLISQGRKMEAWTLYKLAIEEEPSLVVVGLDESWRREVRTKPERFGSFLQHLQT